MKQHGGLRARTDPTTSARWLRLSQKTFSPGDRAMRESSLTVTSFLFGPFGGIDAKTSAPVDLNALLSSSTNMISPSSPPFSGETLKPPSPGAKRPASAASASTICSGMESTGLYFDYDFVHSQPSSIPLSHRVLRALHSASPCLACTGPAPRCQSSSIFEQPGGLADEHYRLRVQWDASLRLGAHQLACRLRPCSLRPREQRPAHRPRIHLHRQPPTTLTMASSMRSTTLYLRKPIVTVAAGYKFNVVGFGWTNAVYLKMQQLLAAAK